MIPRFLRTFLIISALIILTTLYILYPLHTYPLTSSNSNSAVKDGRIDMEEDILAREDHWDKGGVEPDYPARVGEGEGEARGGQRIAELDLELDNGNNDDGEEEEEVLTVPHLPTAHPQPRPSSTHPDSNSDTTSTSHDTNKVASSEDGLKELKELESGGVIMSRLGNATAKAELGRAAWKLLHTMTLRFPEHPTPSERSALKTYMHLFARLYPCGECAEEFQGLLKEFPVQTSSRKSASLWLCSMHNLVNARLGKEEFDCNMLEGTYDCGCGEETVGDELASEKGEEAVGEGVGTKGVEEEDDAGADREEVKTAPRVEMW